MEQWVAQMPPIAPWVSQEQRSHVGWHSQRDSPLATSCMPVKVIHLIAGPQPLCSR